MQSVAAMDSTKLSESPVPPLEIAEGNSAPSQDAIKDEQWRAMKRIIDATYDFRQPE